MPNYISTLDPAKVQAVIDQRGDALMARWNVDDPSFALYLSMVSKRVAAVIHLSLDDMPDVNTRDAYDDGLTPDQCVSEAMEYWQANGDLF